MIDFLLYFKIIKRKMILNKNEFVTIRVMGDSMLPTMKNGEIYNVRFVECHQVRVGDVLVYNIWNTHFTVHRVINIKYQNGHYIFKTKGDNNQVEDDYELNEAQILGVINFT